MAGAANTVKCFRTTESTDSLFYRRRRRRVRTKGNRMNILASLQFDRQGKVYTVINRRHGRVLEAVGMDEKEKSFMVEAQIPVIESEGFANEIRKTTSGQANPSLRFSHYEIIDGDPYFEPVEDEDNSDDEYEAKMESGLRANKLRKEVRRRKGLHVDDEVVVHAEKQRTLKK